MARFSHSCAGAKASNPAVCMTSSHNNCWTELAILELAIISCIVLGWVVYELVNALGNWVRVPAVALQGCSDDFAKVLEGATFVLREN